MFYSSFGSETLRTAWTTGDPIYMVKRVNHFLIPMKKQGGECTCNISVLKKISGKQFKIFPKFADVADNIIKFFNL